MEIKILVENNIDNQAKWLGKGLVFFLVVAWAWREQGDEEGPCQPWTWAPGKRKHCVLVWGKCCWLFESREGNWSQMRTWGLNSILCLSAPYKVTGRVCAEDLLQLSVAMNGSLTLASTPMGACLLALEGVRHNCSPPPWAWGIKPTVTVTWPTAELHWLLTCFFTRPYGGRVFVRPWRTSSSTVPNLSTEELHIQRIHLSIAQSLSSFLLVLYQYFQIHL